MSEPPVVAACDDITKRYPGGEAVDAVSAVDLEVRAGQVLVLAGPSGSGKSTLLRMLALVERPTSGRIVIDGTDATRLRTGAARRLRRRTITYLFQRPTDNLLGYLDAGEQLTLAARLRNQPRPDAAALLARFGLGDRLHAQPWHLSGGEQQRLAVATALAATTPILLADEPTSELDRASAATVVEALRTVAASGVAVVAASHDPLLVEAADVVAELTTGRLTELRAGSPA
jgi:ABC-type lipoprotein export system ATPase subunit